MTWSLMPRCQSKRFLLPQPRCLSSTTTVSTLVVSTSNVESTAGTTKHVNDGGVFSATAASLASLVIFYCCTRCRRRLARTVNAVAFLEEPIPYVDSPQSLAHFDSPTHSVSEQLLMIQAQIEDIEARQSFTSAGTVRRLPWIRPPEYTS